MAKGIRVAKEGKDATRTGGKNLAFTSEAQSLKISDQFHDTIRTITIPTPGNVTLTITHNLLYAPVFRLFVEQPIGSGKWYNDSFSSDLLTDITIDPNITSWKVLDINENSIKIFFGTSGTVGRPVTFRFKYWIFEDSLRGF